MISEQYCNGLEIRIKELLNNVGELETESKTLREALENFRDIRSMPVKMSEFSSSEALSDLFDYVELKSREALEATNEKD